MSLQNVVFVLDSAKRPLAPCRPARARQLLRDGKAAVFRRFPFTLILKQEVPAAVTPELRLKLDPGSKVTGIALTTATGRVRFAAELQHRGQAIKKSLDARRALRRSRRSRKTRYRAPRFLNRTRPAGWLPPSLQHRVETTMTWVERLRRYAPVGELAVERVRFDLQQIENPEISGVQYQQGTLWGYEVKGYVLQKFNHTCAYCDATDVPLEIEHVVCKARGGTNRVSNLAAACAPCNMAKGARPVEQFLADDLARLARVLAQLKRPLKHAAAVNATRNALFTALLRTGLPVEAGSGGRTKFNRTGQGYPKAHWIDAACVGVSGASVDLDPALSPLCITATGHGSRQMCGTNRHGFPIRHRSRQQQHFGFRTGDLVVATVPHGKRAGRHEGRVLCRTSGSFDVQTAKGRAAGISHRHCHAIQQRDGYAYALLPAFLPTAKAVGFLRSNRRGCYP